MTQATGQRKQEPQIPSALSDLWFLLDIAPVTTGDWDERSFLREHFVVLNCLHGGAEVLVVVISVVVCQLYGQGQGA